MRRDDLVEHAENLKKMPEAVDRIRERAAARGCRVDSSALVELENYTHHLGVRELPEGDLSLVVSVIGEIAAMECNESVFGGDVRQAIFRLCEEAHKDCSAAAGRILRVASETLDVEETSTRIHKEIVEEAGYVSGEALLKL